MKNQIITYKKSLNNLAEIGWQEKKTTAYIANTISGKPLIKGFGETKTGLLYKVGKGREAILLRADIDALETKNGPRHTCGHSSHTAALMGALQFTKEQEEKLSQQDKAIYFLFQPAEETYPSGAKAFMEKAKDLLPQIKYAFATHVSPLLPLHTIGLKPDSLWARGDYMEIEIQGKTVHVKDAQKGKDALEAAALVVLAIKQIQKDFSKDIRINVGVMHGGLQANTVANSALLKGDIRLRQDSLQIKIKTRIQHELSKIEKQTGTEITLTYYDGYPTVINNPKLTKEITSFLKQTKKWSITQANSLFSFGCEDFCFIAERVPSTMALIGTGDTHDIHEVDCTISDKGTLAIYYYFCTVIEWWLQK